MSNRVVLSLMRTQMKQQKIAVFKQTVINLKEWLETVPDAPVDVLETTDSFSIRPRAEDTFPVEINREEDGVVVCAFHWHCHLKDHDAAAAVCLWLMTPFARLVHEQIGKLPFASWIENYTENGWEKDDMVMFKDPSIPSSWVLKQNEKIIRSYFQQHVVDWRTPIEQIRPGVKLTPEGLPLGSYIGLREDTATESSADRWPPKDRA